MEINRDLLIKSVCACSDSPLERVAIAIGLTRADWLIDVMVTQAREAGVAWADLAAALESGRSSERVNNDEEGIDGQPRASEVVVTAARGPAQLHDGKYHALWKHLSELDLDEIRMSFGDVESVLGFTLPPSSRHHVPHWHGYKGSAVARAVVDAGWKATNVDLARETVMFVRGRPGRRNLDFRVASF